MYCSIQLLPTWTKVILLSTIQVMGKEGLLVRLKKLFAHPSLPYIDIHSPEFLRQFEEVEAKINYHTEKLRKEGMREEHLLLLTERANIQHILGYEEAEARIEVTISQIKEQSVSFYLVKKD